METKSRPQFTDAELTLLERALEAYRAQQTARSDPFSPAQRRAFLGASRKVREAITDRLFDRL